MSKAGVVAASTLTALLLTMFFVWGTWNYVFDNIDRGMVKMFWGTLTGTGGMGGQ